MIECEGQPLNIVVCAIEEIINGKSIGLIDTFGSRDRLNHRSNNDVWIDYSQVKYWPFILHKLPCCLFCQFLRGIVAEYWTFRVNSLLRSNLGSMVY